METTKIWSLLFQPIDHFHVTFRDSKMLIVLHASNGDRCYVLT